MLAPLEYVDHRRRNLLVLAMAAVVITTVVAVLLTRHPTTTVLVSSGPPYPAAPAIAPRDWTVAQSLPVQDGPHDGQVWAPWTLLAVSADGQDLTLSWNNAGSDCEHAVRPTAVHVEQDDHAVRVGLISPAGGAPCTAVGLIGIYRVTLRQPVWQAVYRIGA